MEERSRRRDETTRSTHTLPDPPSRMISRPKPPESQGRAILPPEPLWCPPSLAPRFGPIRRPSRSTAPARLPQSVQVWGWKPRAERYRWTSTLAWLGTPLPQPRLRLRLFERTLSHWLGVGLPMRPIPTQALRRLRRPFSLQPRRQQPRRRVRCPLASHAYLYAATRVMGAWANRRWRSTSEALSRRRAPRRPRGRASLSRSSGSRAAISCRLHVWPRRNPRAGKGPRTGKGGARARQGASAHAGEAADRGATPLPARSLTRPLAVALPRHVSRPALPPPGRPTPRPPGHVLFASPPSTPRRTGQLRCHRVPVPMSATALRG